MQPTAAQLAALGVHDPSAPHATQQLQLLEYLLSLGATTEDLVAYRDELPGLAAVVAVRGGGAGHRGHGHFVQPFAQRLAARKRLRVAD